MTKYVLALLIKSNVITVEKLSKLKKKLFSNTKANVSQRESINVKIVMLFFNIYGQFVDHKKRNHSKVKCDICETEIYYKNIKRHMEDVHAGFTPRSTLAWMQMQQEKKNQYKYFCELC